MAIGLWMCGVGALCYFNTSPTGFWHGLWALFVIVAALLTAVNIDNYLKSILAQRPKKIYKLDNNGGD